MSGTYRPVLGTVLTVEANGMVANFANTRKGKGCITRIQFAVRGATFPGRVKNLQTSMAPTEANLTSRPHPSPNLSLPVARHLQKEYRLDQGSPHAKEKAYCAGSRLSIIVVQCCMMSNHTILLWWLHDLEIPRRSLVWAKSTVSERMRVFAYSSGASAWNIPSKRS